MSVHLYVDVCACVYTCECSCKCMHVPAHGGPGWHLESSSISFIPYSLRQGLWIRLRVRWHDYSHQATFPQISSPLSRLTLQVSSHTHLVFTCNIRIWTWVLLLGQQVLEPLSNLSTLSVSWNFLSSPTFPLDIFLRVQTEKPQQSPFFFLWIPELSSSHIACGSWSSCLTDLSDLKWPLGYIINLPRPSMAWT